MKTVLLIIMIRIFVCSNIALIFKVNNNGNIRSKTVNPDQYKSRMEAVAG